MLALVGCNGWLTRSSLPSSARFPCLDVRSRNLSPPRRGTSPVYPGATVRSSRPNRLAPGHPAVRDGEAEPLVQAERAGRILAVHVQPRLLVAGVAVGGQGGGQQQRGQPAPPPGRAGAELADPGLPHAG